MHKWLEGWSTVLLNICHGPWKTVKLVFETLYPSRSSHIFKFKRCSWQEGAFSHKNFRSLWHWTLYFFQGTYSYSNMNSCLKSLFVSNSFDPLLPHCWIFLILLYIQLPYMYAFWACINHITSLEFSSVKWRGKLWSGFQFDSLWWKDSDSTCVQSASTTDRATELLSSKQLWVTCNLIPSMLHLLYNLELITCLNEIAPWQMT